MNNNKFYDLISDTYDEMISFEKSLQNKTSKFKNFVSSGVKKGADCGCGTGVDSIALSKLGLEITAFDPSFDMIKKAEANAKANNAEIDFYNYSIIDIPDKFDSSFDLVVSFGNTFANVQAEYFNNSIKRFFEILKPGGTLLIHILNYNKILKESNRIVNITKSNNHTFIRFYDFENESIKFNILTFNQSNLSDHQLITTQVYPHTKESFQDALVRNGFKHFGYYSNLNFQHFDRETSKDLFIRAKS